VGGAQPRKEGVLGAAPRFFMMFFVNIWRQIPGLERRKKEKEKEREKWRREKGKRKRK